MRMAGTPVPVSPVPAHPPARGGTFGLAARDDDLLAVLEALGQVDRDGIGIVQHPARRADGIVDPFPVREPVEAGFDDVPGDVDDELRRDGAKRRRFRRVDPDGGFGGACRPKDERGQGKRDQSERGEEFLHAS
jgi:hypothetical protein